LTDKDIVTQKVDYVKEKRGKRGRGEREKRSWDVSP